jgi:hypothetical protein
MTSSKTTQSLLAAAAFVAAGSVFASDNPGAHQHGHAELQLAIEGNQIDLIFTSPAYNLLGFEHRARTDAQKDLVADTTSWLGETPLVTTAGGNCTVMNAVVNHQLESDGHDHHDEHRHNHHDSHDHHDEHNHSDSHDHDHGHYHEGESSHSDVEVTQTLSCSNLDASETLSTPLTERFPEIEHLRIEWVWSGGQGSARLETGDKTFSLRAQ